MYIKFISETFWKIVWMNCALDFMYSISQKEVKKIWVKWESLINLSLILNEFDTTKNYTK